MTSSNLRNAGLLAAVALLPTTAEAQVTHLGANNGAGFPSYVRMADGTAVIHCIDNELCGELLLPGFGPLFFPFNFPLISDYYSISTEMELDDRSLSYSAGISATFGNAAEAVQNGTQIVTPRCGWRVRMDAASAGTWYLHHPYGTAMIDHPGGEMDWREEVDCLHFGLVEPPEVEPEPPFFFPQPEVFMVGPFCGSGPGDWFQSVTDQSFNKVRSLCRWDPTIEPAAPEGALGDPAVEHEIVGSPYEQNYVMLVGPNGETFMTDLFTVIGVEMDLGDQDIRPLCFGDGGDQMGCEDCPCGNNTTIGAGSGCLNSTGMGARMLATGVPSASNGFAIGVNGMPANTSAVLVRGLNSLPANPMNPCPQGSGTGGTVLGGLRCAGGSITRHGLRVSDETGLINGAGDGWDVADGIFDGVGVGATRTFQVLYRDMPANSCGTGLNTTNGIEITAQP